MVRKLIFWSHLVAGMLASLILALITVTGVIMTYERQIVRWVEHSSLSETAAGSDLMTADDMIGAARGHWPNADRLQIVIPQTEVAPIRVTSGRRLLGFLDPTSGQKLEDKAASARAFFSSVRSLHRWLGQTGENRAFGKSIVGISTLVFVMMVLSGLYLWLPKIWSKKSLHPRIWFKAPASTPQAKYFTWHHSFAFWTWPILLALSVSGLVFAYKGFQNQISDAADWAFTAQSLQIPNATKPAPHQGALTFQSMVSYSKSMIPRAQRIHIYLPDNDSAPVRLRADAGSGGEPTKRTDIEFDQSTGTVLAVKPFKSTPAGRQTIIWLRYLHTGEVFGVFGQTVAGLASFAALFLIYSGFCLGLRRLKNLRHP